MSINSTLISYFGIEIISLSLSLSLSVCVCVRVRTRARAYIYIYIYIYMCVCVCVCVQIRCLIQLIKAASIYCPVWQFHFKIFWNAFFTNFLHDLTLLWNDDNDDDDDDGWWMMMMIVILLLLIISSNIYIALCIICSKLFTISLYSGVVFYCLRPTFGVHQI